MPKSQEPAKGGLGTSIVQALEKQLVVEAPVTDSDPGTSGSLVHLAATAAPDVAAV
jgi:hypothetical protein